MCICIRNGSRISCSHDIHDCVDYMCSLFYNRHALEVLSREDIPPCAWRPKHWRLDPCRMLTTNWHLQAHTCKASPSGRERPRSLWRPSLMTAPRSKVSCFTTLDYHICSQHRSMSRHTHLHEAAGLVSCLH
jgi:hypothetical protein